MKLKRLREHKKDLIFGAKNEIEKWLLLFVSIIRFLLPANDKT